MFKELLAHHDPLSWPVVAMVTFMIVFALVVIRVWRRGANHPDDLDAAALPLADDSGASIANGGQTTGERDEH